jgi:D-alanyl-D-alanine carboxypeptidase
MVARRWMAAMAAALAVATATAKGAWAHTCPVKAEDVAADPQVQAALKQVDRLLADAMGERNLPGLSAGVVYDQALIWSRGFGYADVARKVAADADSIYEIGSITKLFNATMLMQLRDAGKLSLDDPIEKYLPEFRMKSRFPDQRPPTFRQVVSHTAGLPREYAFDVGPTGDLQQFPAAVVLAGISDKEIQYPAYTGFHYSNLGIYVIGQALQRIAGEPYTQYMQEHVFTPLGMDNTGWEYTEAMKPHRAVGYRPAAADGSRQVAPLFLPGDFGVSAGGIQSSVKDLAKFLSLQFCDGPAGGAQILGGTSLREMRSSLVPAPNWMWGYGIGWEVERYPDHNGICHSGGTLGFASKVRAVSDLKLGFVVLTNQDTDADELSRKAVELLIPAFEAVAARRQQQEVPPLPPYASLFLGHYASDRFGQADVLIRDGRLTLITDEARQVEGTPWLLEAEDERTLRIISGSGDFDGQTIGFVPATSTEPARILILGVPFPRAGASPL